MMPTKFFLIRHAVVTPEARTKLYGRMDVDVCAECLEADAGICAALTQRLPADAVHFVTPLIRTRQTLAAIRGPDQTEMIEEGLIEQDLGDWQGLPHAELPAYLQNPAHAFWPLAAAETPPSGENMDQVVMRVGEALERLAGQYPGRNVVAVSHGGAIRAAVAHALGVGAQAALHFSIQNLSLTQLERHPQGWRVVAVNEMVGSAGN